MNCYVDKMEWNSFFFETLDWKVWEVQKKKKGLQNKKGKSVPQQLCNYFYVSYYMTKYLKNGKAFINQQAYFFSYIAFLYFQLQEMENAFNCHLMEQVNSVYCYTTLLFIKFLSLKNAFCLFPYFSFIFF